MFSLFWLTRNRVRLAKSEERYRNIVEDSPALVCRLLPDGTITDGDYHLSHGMLRRYHELGLRFLSALPLAERVAKFKQMLDNFF